MGQFVNTTHKYNTNMSDAAAPAPAAPAKAKKAAKPKKPATHPKTTVMVAAAVAALKDRKGSSLPAIKKYIGANYKVDIVKHAPFVKKAIKSMVEKKTLVQVKGKGASGSFKLGKVEKPKKVKKTPKKKPAKKVKKAKTPKKAKKPAAKKAKSPKKAAKKTPKKAAKPAKKTAKKPAAKKPAKKAAPKKK